MGDLFKVNVDKNFNNSDSIGSMIVPIVESTAVGEAYIGNVIYTKDNNQFYGYNGTSWISLTGGGGGGGDVTGTGTSDRLVKWGVGSNPSVILDSGVTLDGGDNMSGIQDLSVGTVIAGIWNGEPIAVGYGGTGATDAPGARNNIGGATGASFMGLGPVAIDQFFYTSDPNTVTNAPIASHARLALEEAAGNQIVTEEDTQTLENKTINSTNNTITFGNIDIGLTPGNIGEVLTVTGLTTAEWAAPPSATSPWILGNVNDYIQDTTFPGSAFGTNNLVFGAAGTESTEVGVNTTRMFFIADGTFGSGSFRFGTATGSQWDAINRGPDSFAGGLDNISSGNHSVCTGGENNICFGIDTFIGAGSGNSASGTASAVLAGQNNTVSTTRNIIGAGQNNNVSGNDNIIGAGVANVITGGSTCYIGAGNANEISASGSAIGAGDTNRIRSDNSFIGAGNLNNIDAPNGAICAGNRNQLLIDAHNCFIGAGQQNTVDGVGDSSFNCIVAGQSNVINAVSYSGILAGFTNIISSSYCAIGAGSGGTIEVSCDFSGIMAGTGNRVGDGLTSCTNSVIAAGAGNQITNGSCFIGAGSSNTCAGVNSSVLCGNNNQANGQNSSVISGSGNQVSGTNSCVAGGSNIILTENNTLAVDNIRIVGNIRYDSFAPTIVTSGPISASDIVIALDSSVEPLNLTLPTAPPNGHTIIMKVINDANQITINRGGTDTITPISGGSGGGFTSYILTPGGAGDAPTSTLIYRSSNTTWYEV